MSDPECRKLSELRVVDLKIELEKRGLDKNGVKQMLIDRLQKALIEEGEDPDTYMFKLSEEKPSRRSTTGKTDSDKGESDEFNMEKKDDVHTDNKSEENRMNTINVVKTEDDEGSQKDEDHESPITLTLEEEEKIQDMEAMSETTSKEDTFELDEKKKTSKKEENHDAKKDKSNSTSSATTNNNGSAREGVDKTSSNQDGKKVPSNANPRAIWISNVAMNTRACDIKQALSQYGKVVGAKVVVNAKYPGTCCFGYVTMGSVDDANKVIENLNNTELNGQIIKIEKFDVVRSEQLKQIKNGRKTPEHSSKTSSTSKKEKSPPKPSKEDEAVSAKPSDDENKEKSKSNEVKSEKETSDKKEEKKESDKDKKEKSEKKESKDKNKDDERKRHSSRNRKSRERKRTSSSSHERGGRRSRSRERKHREILTFDKIREARERQRLREKERLLREEVRNRQEELARQRQIELRQRSEAQRLEREREKLRIEREKIEREKNELIRLERERQKIERERIELEKMELQRTRLRLEEDRRAVKRPAPFRREGSFEDRKRSSDGRHFNEAPPPPPHYEGSSKLRDSPPKKFSSKDYKSQYIHEKRSRDYETERNRTSSSSLSRPSSSSKLESRSFDGIREREAPPSVSSRITKEHRFERERSPHYRSGNERRVTEDIPRFGATSSSSWSASSTLTPKPFGNSSSSKWPSKEDSWRSNNSERWNSSRSQTFTGNSGMSVTPACPPPPGINSYPDRFDYNKIPSSVRKY